MAALEEGFQYGLSSNSHTPSSKTVVHVKLTDTSLKVIEDYLKRQSTTNQKPCIQFKGNHGTIQIPEQGDNLRSFQFSLSEVQGDRNGSFDTVCQRNTMAGPLLTVEGSMTNKLQIHATSELFQATKDRVAKAELDHMKVSTKEIKHSGPRIGKKKTTVLRTSQPLPQPRHQTIPPVKPRLPTNPPVNFVKRPSPSHGSHGHAVSPHTPSVLSTAKPTSPSLSSFSTGSGVGGGGSANTSTGNISHNTSTGNISHNTSTGNISHNTSTGNISHNTSTGNISQHKNAGNPAVMSKSYRDRIIHLLAIRPYKKPELMLRLRKDGVREKDKDSLGTILSQVAVSKDNTYTLAKHLLHSDVRLDWQFYTEEDRQILKKKLQSASSVSPVASPANRSPDSQSTVPAAQKKPEAQKRPIEDSHSQYNAKKKRISLYEKTEKTEKTSNSKADHHRSSSTDRRSSSTDRRSNSTSRTDLSDKKENINDTVDSTSDTPEYMKQYFSIASDEQRQQYKQDFNKEYTEYRELHTNIEKVSKKFFELQMLRKKTPKDTIEYEDLEQRIRKEYMMQKKDSKYTDQKKKFDYLHEKLAFIKRLIVDYDQRTLVPTS